jgi:hypothetical protein
MMKRILWGVLGVVLIACVGWQSLRFAKGQLDAKVASFHSEAEELIQGLQQYKEFIGNYPPGNNLDIAKALSGQTEKKVLILSTRTASRNQQGELLDPWGTPLQFYLAGNSVLIRSAGPNKAWEDSAVATSDDLYRTN